MDVPAYPFSGGRLRRFPFAYELRVIRVLVGSDFKLKYADSVLGYVWSLAKPLALFGILYAVFGRALRFGGVIDHYPLFLLLGIVLFMFFSDATSSTMTSIVARQSLLRRLRFPRLIIPVSATLFAGVTFAVNLVAIMVFVTANRIVPRPDWIFLLPLLGELYVFTLGVSLILATLYVRFRDIAQIWELVARVLFYATPIIYPLQLLPEWFQRISLVNPVAQMFQDARAVILYEEPIITMPAVYGTSWARAMPFVIVVAVFLLGFGLFRRNERWFAERA